MNVKVLRVHQYYNPRREMPLGTDYRGAPTIQYRTPTPYECPTCGEALERLNAASIINLTLDSPLPLLCRRGCGGQFMVKLVDIYKACPELREQINIFKEHIKEQAQERTHEPEILHD